MQLRDEAMTTQARAMTSSGIEALSTARFGFWTALGTALSTTVTFAIAILTPPLSGSLCKEDCFTYPYLDIAARFPRDYYWMFAAIPATLLYVAWMIGLNARAIPNRRLLAQLGLVLSVMSALTLVGDYFVQLAVIEPSILAGESDGISLLTQYNPHGAFIALEELGYLLMSLSLACMALSLPRATRLERTIRWLFIGGFVGNVATFGWFLIAYGHARGYLFEITVISVDWLMLIAGALMATAVFRRDVVAAIVNHVQANSLFEDGRHEDAPR
jgi:hypothetical protein